MTTYTITSQSQILGYISAPTAEHALRAFCDAHPDDDYGFSRGGLVVDADTRGAHWATIITDAGRIMAEIE